MKFNPNECLALFADDFVNLGRYEEKNALFIEQ